jgi:transposase
VRRLSAADLNVAQSEHVKPFIEWDQEVRQRPDGLGGRWGDARRMLNGVLWILRTGASWKDLPSRYGFYQSCHRRFQQWQRSGVLDGILWALCDASFAGGKRGAIALVQHGAAKGARSWQSWTATVFRSPSGSLRTGLEDRTAFRLVEELPPTSSRWERYATNFLGMVQLGCALILLRHL